MSRFMDEFERVMETQEDLREVLETSFRYNDEGEPDVVECDHCGQDIDAVDDGYYLIDGRIFCEDCAKEYLGIEDWDDIHSEYYAVWGCAR